MRAISEPLTAEEILADWAQAEAGLPSPAVAAVTPLPDRSVVATLTLNHCGAATTYFVTRLVRGPSGVETAPDVLDRGPDRDGIWETADRAEAGAVHARLVAEAGGAAA